MSLISYLRELLDDAKKASTHVQVLDRIEALGCWVVGNGDDLLDALEDAWKALGQISVGDCCPPEHYGYQKMCDCDENAASAVLSKHKGVWSDDRIHATEDSGAQGCEMRSTEDSGAQSFAEEGEGE
jgi:hypothetical protein